MEVHGKTNEGNVRKNNLTEVTLCEPCKNEYKKSKASGTCKQCRELMCQLCFKHHLITKSFRRHEFIENNTNAKSNVSVKLDDDNAEKCQEHEQETIKFYCQTHDVVGCGECMLMGGHRNCKLEYIRDLSTDFQNTDYYIRLTKRTEALETTNKENVQRNVDCNSEMKDKAVVGIKTFISELRGLLDSAEKSLIANVNQLHVDNERLVETLSAESAIDIVKQMLKADNYSENALFINAVSCNQTLNEIEKNVGDTVEKYNELKKFEFKSNKHLIEKLKDGCSFGTIATITDDEDKRSQTARIKETPQAIAVKSYGNDKRNTSSVENKGSGHQIFVKQGGRNTFTLDVNMTDSIDEVKAKIQTKTGIPKEKQHLVYGLHRLSDEQTLSDYNIFYESTLQLFIKTRFK